MKSMINNSTQSIVSKTMNTLKRFPIPCLLLFVFCISIFYVEYKNTINFTNIEQYLFALFYGFFWFIGLKLIAESLNWQQKYYYIIGVIVFSFIVYKTYTSSIAPVLLSLGLFLSVFIAAFLNKEATSMQIWNFNYLSWIHICFTILVAMIILAMTLALNLSLSFLFEFKFNIDYIFMFISTLLAPFIAITGIQKNYNITKTPYIPALKNILTYIILPLLFIYTVMLYIYIAKIIFTWTIPKGGVSYNISLFSCFGIITYLISYPLHNEEGIIRFFSRILFKALLLPLALLSTSIGIRVYEYGITEARYIVILCTLWLISSCLFSFTRYKKHIIKFIYLSIVTLLLISAFIPIQTNKTIEISNQEQEIKQKPE